MSDYEDEEALYMQGYLGVVTDEEYVTEEEGGTFFEDDADPLDLLNNMEQTDRQPFELLATRRRHRRQLDSDEGEIEEEEEEEDDEEGGGAAAATEEAGAGGIAAAAATAGGGEGVRPDMVEDQWNDELAQRMGLQPVTNRKKQRNRERWRRRAAKKGGPRRKDYPEEAARKLGEANLLYASQRHHEAIALLMEVIRLAPNLPDPYHTLGLLHEAVGNSKKALDFFMIAAHLTPRDIGLWKRLAAMSSDHGLVRQAVYCYSQILKRDREDVDARFDRALLYAELEDHKKAIEGFEQVRTARPDHAEAARALARVYYRTGQPEKAVEVLSALINNYPAQADLTHANILAELLSESHDWAAVLSLVHTAATQLCPPGEELPIDLQIKAGISHACLGDMESSIKDLDPLFVHPVEDYADLYIEVTTAMEALNRYDVAETFLRPVAESPELGGPEVWRRLAECRRHLHGPGAVAEVWEEFTQDLSPEHPGFVDAMVCLAEAHREIGDSEAAAAALSKLEESLPTYEPTSSAGDPQAAEEQVLRRATVLLACGKKDMFLDVALPALGSTLRALSREAEALGNMDAAARKRLRNVGRRRRGAALLQQQQQGVTTEGGIFVGYVSDKRRRQRQRAAAATAAAAAASSQQQRLTTQTQASEDYPMGGTEATGGGGGVSDSEAEDEGGPAVIVLPGFLKEDRPFMLLIDTLRALLDEHRAADARELAQAVIDICGRRFSDRSKRDILKLLLFEADVMEREFSPALGCLKSACARWPRCALVWNALSRYLLAAGGARQAAKFLTPLRNKNPNALPVALALGHCHLLNWQYVQALGEYFQAYRLAPEEPLVLFCIGVAMVNRACTRKGLGVTDRHAAVLQAFAYLSDYAKHRYDSQESAYNLGRAAHQLGLLHLAAPMYKKVLDGSSTNSSSGGGGNNGGSDNNTGNGGGQQQQEGGNGSDEAFDIKRDAAYNLALIYQSSGAVVLAKKVMKEYLTI